MSFPAPFLSRCSSTGCVETRAGYLSGQQVQQLRPARHGPRHGGGHVAGGGSRLCVCREDTDRRSSWCTRWTPTSRASTRCARSCAIMRRRWATTRTRVETSTPCGCWIPSPTLLARPEERARRRLPRRHRLSDVLRLARDAMPGRDGRRPQGGRAAAGQLRAQPLNPGSSGPVSLIAVLHQAQPDAASINGGPLTIEFHDSGVPRRTRPSARSPSWCGCSSSAAAISCSSTRSTATRCWTRRSTRKTTSNLIVRVWGWSGYFVELDKCYQDHIMARMELAV